MEWLKNLRAMKESSGLTTKEISKKSGIPEPTLEKLFSGATKEPKLTTLQPLVKCLGFSLDELDTGIVNQSRDAINEDLNFDPSFAVILENYKRMNPEGQKALALHSLLLVQSGMYSKNSNIQTLKKA